MADSDFFGLAENAEKQVLHISSLEKGEIMPLNVERLPNVPPGNIFHHDSLNVGMNLRDVTLDDKHKGIMLMGDAFSENEISFRICDQRTGKRWRVILNEEGEI